MFAVSYLTFTKFVTSEDMLHQGAISNFSFLFCRSHAQTFGQSQGVISADIINVRAGGKMEALTAADLFETNMTLIVISLTVNGDGYFRANRIKVIAKNFTVDLAGIFHVDFSGHAAGEGPGAGLTKQSYHLGGGGGGHGGRGGNSRYGYISAQAYDSIYTPTQFGSGGGNSGGGRGGGDIQFEVEHTVRIEGRLSANGEDGQHSSGGGGAGGSIWGKIQHLDGEGSLEVKGGDGNSYGGGGGGGRAAIYHSGQNAWTGTYDMNGGSGTQGYAGAGTFYIKDTEKDEDILIVDNAGNTASNKITEVEELHLGGIDLTDDHNWNTQEIWSYGGVHLSTTGTPYSYHDEHGTEHRFHFHKIRDGPTNSYYRTTNTDPVITITFPTYTYVDHVRVFPHCDR